MRKHQDPEPKAPGLLFAELGSSNILQASEVAAGQMLPSPLEAGRGSVEVPATAEGAPIAEGGPSLSLGHNSNGINATADALVVQELPFRLTGSQRKTAFALEKNVARLVEEAGIERVGFLTLTVGENSPIGFQQVATAVEASRRINSLATGLLKDLFRRAIVVTERHKSGAIHFHLIVETRADIRGAFDFEAFMDARQARTVGAPDLASEKRYAESAPEHLRALWGILRERLPGYGFGRAELTPIYKGAEAISRYVAKYVQKNLFNRLPEDKGKKLVRYLGWSQRQLKPNEFSWATPKACEWRRKARAIAATARLWQPEDMRREVGPRWAFRVNRIMSDALLPVADDWHEGLMTRDQVELCADFLMRDIRSWESSMSASLDAASQAAMWERALTAEEWAELEADLHRHRLWQLQNGQTFEEWDFQASEAAEQSAVIAAQPCPRQLSLAMEIPKYESQRDYGD